MSVSWKVKALLQQLFSHLPGGESVNYFFQRHVTRGYPRPVDEVLRTADVARAHLDAARRYGSEPIAATTFYEFGAGWDLVGPLLFYGLGVERQIVVDIRRLLRVALVNAVISQLSETTEIGLSRLPTRLLADDINRAIGTLVEAYGIDYRAPLDARATRLAEGSIDHVTSTNTLEHVGVRDITPILRESYRILRPGGLSTHRIDYQDHYSFFDRNISAYNYLRYSDRRWALLNPSLMFQNRLRHRDHLALIRGAGFEILDEGPEEVTAEDRAVVSALPLAGRFRSYTVLELAIRTALVIARKPA